MNHYPELACAIASLLLLLAWCGRLMWQNRRAKCDMDRMLATGIWSAYTRGDIDRNGNRLRTPEDLQ